MEQIATVIRRLAAVAFADVAGWSRLIEANDVATLRAWKALRTNLIEPKIREHGGRLLEVAGDAVLVEFPSAVASVNWALDMQRGIAGAAAEQADALSVRIGINVEDVIVDEGKLIGDGVNIASRVHQLAAPGEIVVTGAVRDYVWNKMPVVFIDLGERQLKNISRPVRAFKVRASGAENGTPARASPHLFWDKRPSIAVLPFRNSGGNPDEEYFGEGITEDIISGLSRSHSLYVIARNSTLRYRDTRMDSREVASELGVRYLLQGSVRRATSRLRISSELIDAASNRAIWAEKYEGAESEIFAFQDRISASIVGSLEPRLRNFEAARVRDHPTESLDAYHCVLKAMSRIYQFTGESYRETRQLLERAIALDPSYAQAHAYMAWWYNFYIGEGLSSNPAEDRRSAIAASRRAVELDAEDAFALAVAGHVTAFMAKNTDEAVELFDQALSLNDNSAFAWGLSALTFAYQGRGDEALGRLQNVWRLNPYDPLNFYFWIVAGIAEFVAGRYSEAIAWSRKSKRANPRFIASLRMLAACLALSGDEAEARAVGQELLAVEPSFRISTFVSWYPLRRAEDLTRLAAGLRAAGLPE